MKTVRVDQVPQRELPGRSVRVMSEMISARNMTFGICEVPPHSAMPPHSHVQEELIFILDGRGTTVISDVTYPVVPGTLVIFPSGEEHQTRNDGDEVLRFTFCFSPTVVVGSYDKPSA